MGASIQKRLEKVMIESKGIIDILRVGVHYFIAENDMMPGNSIIPPEKRRVLMKPGAEAIAKAKDLTAEFSDPIVILSAPANPNSGNVVVRCHMKNKSGEHIASGMGAYETVGVPFNTAIKMASKSAFIDATIRAAAISDSFTQDIQSDMAHANQTTVAHPTTQNFKSLPAKEEAVAEIGQAIKPDPAALELIEWIKSNIPYASDIPVMNNAVGFEAMTVSQLQDVIDQWNHINIEASEANQAAVAAETEKPEIEYNVGGLLGDLEGELELV